MKISKVGKSSYVILGHPLPWGKINVLLFGRYVNEFSGWGGGKGEKKVQCVFLLKICAVHFEIYHAYDPQSPAFNRDNFC